MRRKPTAIVQTNLRIREHLRRRLEAAAKKQNVSMNHEIMSRLERSFDQDDLHTINEMANKLVGWVTPAKQ